jgi:hypothetical protein
MAPCITPDRLRCLVLASGDEHETAAIHRASQRRGGLAACGALLRNDQNDPGVQSFFPVIRQEFQKLGWIEGRNLRPDIRFGRTSMMPISLG